MRFILVSKDPILDYLHYNPISYINMKDFEDLNPSPFLYLNCNKIHDILKKLLLILYISKI